MMMIGIDEAGRGAWAGPIVAAAVYFKIQPRRLHPWLRDSKLLSAGQRQVVYAWLQQYCQIGFGLVSHRYIDRYGLQRANVTVIEKALRSLMNKEARSQKPEAGAPDSVFQILNSKCVVIDYIGGFSKLTNLPSIYSLHKNGEAKFPE